MTQTIHKINKNNSVDIYYHPNDCTAKHTDKNARYRYTIKAVKFTHNDFLKYVDNLKDENEYAQETVLLDFINPIIMAFSKTKNSYIWKLTSDHDVINTDNEFHANLRDVKSEFYRFYC